MQIHEARLIGIIGAVLGSIVGSFLGLFAGHPLSNSIFGFFWGALCVLSILGSFLSLTLILELPRFPIWIYAVSVVAGGVGGLIGAFGMTSIIQADWSLGNNLVIAGIMLSSTGATVSYMVFMGLSRFALFSKKQVD